MHPFLWRFAIRCPEKGRIAIFDTSWNRRIFADRFDRDLGKRETEESLSDIRAFEKQLTDDGTVLVKLFLEISEKEQRKRFKKLEASADTAWRVTEADWERNRRYKKYARITKEMIDATNVPWAPWTVIDAAHKEKAALAIMEAVSSAMEAALEKKPPAGKLPGSSLRCRRINIKKGSSPVWIWKRPWTGRSTEKSWISYRKGWSGSMETCTGTGSLWS